MEKLEDFQQRVVDEQAELETKIKGLQSFIEANILYFSLPLYEQKDMRDQLSTMEHYSLILTRRIRRFSYGKA